MAGILLLCFCSLLLVNTRVFASTEYRPGGNDGNAWQTALTEASFYQVLDTDGQIVRQETVGLPRQTGYLGSALTHCPLFNK